MSKKRKCVVSESLLKESEFLKQGVNEHSAFCSLSQTSFTVASGGITSVSEHVATKRHKSAVVTHSSNTKVSTFLKNDMAIAFEDEHLHSILCSTTRASNPWIVLPV
jgi:hypothetical protein